MISIPTGNLIAVCDLVVYALEIRLIQFAASHVGHVLITEINFVCRVWRFRNIKLAATAGRLPDNSEDMPAPKGVGFGMRLLFGKK